VNSNGTLSNATSYKMPSNVLQAESLAYSSDGSCLAVANTQSNSVTIFTVNTNGTLSKGVLYNMPNGSLAPQSIAFSPDSKFAVTANNGSSDLTVFTVGEC